MNEQIYQKQMKSFKENTRITMDKSQDDFEKQLIYISGGGLGASVFFIEKIVAVKTSHAFALLVLGWIMLGFTLLINLFSHYMAGRYHYKTLCEVDDKTYDYDKVTSRNKRINIFNIISLICLSAGLIFLLIYITINLKP